MSETETYSATLKLHCSNCSGKQGEEQVQIPKGTTRGDFIKKQYPACLICGCDTVYNSLPNV